MPRLSSRPLPFRMLRCYRNSGPLVFWSSGLLVLWFFGPLVLWFFGPLVFWSSGLLVLRSSRPLVSLSTCPLVSLSTRPLVSLSPRPLVSLSTCPLVYSSTRPLVYLSTRLLVPSQNKWHYAVYQILFAVLQCEYLLLQSALRYKPVDKHGMVLPNAVASCYGLLLGRLVPPWVEQKHIVGRCEVENHASSLQ